ncbi:HMG-coA reductase degradation 3 [Oratosquilla oratoria]|uniref:HMG-coA reductase degradation 3 n=1 Tax=Oratosquilla oratoria TaxID=337810 RepID=UPI003F761124
MIIRKMRRVHLNSVMFLVFWVMITEGQVLEGLIPHKVMKDATTSLFGSPRDAIRYAERLAALENDVAAQGQLALARLLGTGVEQSLSRADKESLELAALGVPQAHLTQALLLAHNLSQPRLETEVRAKEALGHYAIAGIMGDPMAQLVMGIHYAQDKDDCDAALRHMSSAARTAIRYVSEEDIFLPEIQSDYVWPDDNPRSGRDGKVPLEEVQLVEYLSVGGNADAAFQAAFYLYAGTGGREPDLRAAERHLKRAASLNNTDALVFLANLQLREKLVPDRETQPYQLLTRALEQGNPTAHVGLAKLYMYGLGGQRKDFSSAMYHLEKAMGAGIVEAFYLVGVLNHGQGFSREAATAWEIPAFLGHVHSAFRLASHHHQVYDGAGSPHTRGQDLSLGTQELCRRAVSLYRRVAMAGPWRNLIPLAHNDYENDRFSAALAKYLLLSDMGYNIAHVNAARILEEEGEEEGPGEVYTHRSAVCHSIRNMWERAAEEDNVIGYRRLADMNYYGLEDVVHRNLTEALRLYLRAASKGDAQAAFGAAYMYERGEGSEGGRNLTEARRLYEGAAGMSPDAEVPVALALAKMNLYLTLNRSLGLDVYALNASSTLNTLEYSVRRWRKSLVDLPLDVVVMIALAIFIIVLIAVRRRARRNT